MKTELNVKAIPNNGIGVEKIEVGAIPDISNLETKEDASAKLQEAKNYTDTKVAGLIDSAPETLDTLKEVADAIQENETVVDALNAAIGNKADKIALQTTNNNVTNLQDNVTELIETKADKLELFSGNYEDLSNKPVIPDVSGFETKIDSNAKLSEAKNYTDEKIRKVNEEINADITEISSEIEGFNESLNHKADKDDVPSKISDLTNDSGFIVSDDVGLMLREYEKTAEATKKLQEAKNYADEKIAELVGTAPETLDTLHEVAQAIQENDTIVGALNNAIGNKANSSDVYNKQEVDGKIDAATITFQYAANESEVPAERVPGVVYLVGVESEKVVTSFTIVDVSTYNTYQAEEGMTWREFINSNYDHHDITIDSEFVKFKNKYIYVNGQYVKADDIIKSNYHHYNTSITGGEN